VKLVVIDLAISHVDKYNLKFEVTMDNNHVELCCMTCNKPLGVFYVDSGAPHYHWYVCEECKDKDENETNED
jgi:hypothetical protein